MLTQLSWANDDADLGKGAIACMVVEVLETKETKSLLLLSTSRKILPCLKPSESIVIKVV
jgi:hypothetical protein